MANNSPTMWVRDHGDSSSGPPVGFPVQFRVVGPDTQKVRSRSRARSNTVVASNPKVRDVQLDWNDPVRTLRVDLDQDKARALGLGACRCLRFVTQTVMNGATTVAAARARGPDRHRRARGAVRAPRPRHAEGHQPLSRARARSCPLSQVARVRYELEEPVLWRRNRDMAITVRADVKDGEQGVSVTQEIRADAEGASKRSCRSAIASTSAAPSRKATRPTAR